MERGEIDKVVWDAHFQVQLPDHKNELLITVHISVAEWVEYWRITRKDARGWWHGATGLIASRLGVANDEWTRMVEFHAHGSKCLGDSSHDYSYLIEGACRE